MNTLNSFFSKDGSLKRAFTWTNQPKKEVPNRERRIHKDLWKISFDKGKKNGIISIPARFYEDSTFSEDEEIFIHIDYYNNIIKARMKYMKNHPSMGDGYLTLTWNRSYSKFKKYIDKNPVITFSVPKRLVGWYYTIEIAPVGFDFVIKEIKQ